MRSLFVRLVFASVLASALAGSSLVGCANRGMVAPSEETGTGGGAGGLPALGGRGGSAASGGKGGGSGGGGGATGKGGGSGGSNVDASCSLVTDALFDHSTTTCGAMFNFEGTTEGATLLPGNAFTRISQGTTPHTYCGTGSLAISATFSGSGSLSKGEVDIPFVVDAGTVDLTGKTLTVHVSGSDPPCTGAPQLTVGLITTVGQPLYPLRNIPVTSNWTTATSTALSGTGINSIIRIALDVSDFSNYAGTIYVDEIDIR
jgi:hypothetical protein